MTADEHDLAVAILTLRINTPAGQWLSNHDFDQYAALVAEAEDEEALLLSMMNLAWYALMNLQSATGRSAAEWLQQIALDVAAGDVGGGS